MARRNELWAHAQRLLSLAMQGSTEFVAEHSDLRFRFRVATYCSLLALAVLGPQPSVAEVSATQIKPLIMAEVSNKAWAADRYPSGGYTSGRFFIDGSFELPPDHKTIGAALVDAIAKGKFEIIEPTQRGQVVEDLSGYLKAQPGCSNAPVRYWSGIGEMSQKDFEKRKRRNSPDLTPYFPGSPRPIDYEFQFKGSLEPYAKATSNLAFYDLGVMPTGDRLLLFKGENYERVTDREFSGLQLEGTIAAFEVPSCRFVGTLDYFKRCFEPKASPFRQPDAHSFAQIVRLNGRPFAIAIWHMICKGVSDVASSYTLRLWDLTANGPVPVIYGFTYSDRH